MITLHHLTYGYHRHAPLGTINGSFEPGSLTAIIGPNGSGKSTLLKTLAGLMPPLSGCVRIATDVTRPIGYLPQLSEFDRQFPISVGDLVLMGCVPDSGLFGRLTPALRRQAREALNTVGMNDVEHVHIGQLSGGQLQRVLFARLLVMRSPIILLDEPFTGIDAETVRMLWQVIRQLHEDGRTLLAVLHDLRQVEQHFPRVVMLDDDGPRWGDCHDLLPPAPSPVTPLRRVL